jgi:DNA-directed RNA polymerase I subunit RPA1
MAGLLHTGSSRRPKGDLSNAVIRTEITGVQFGIYTDAETRARSVVQITSPQAYDAIGTALPSGVYDPRLGPVDSRGGACITCSLPYLHCPGHFGHIELCVPVYHPLLFPRLVSFLRLKCLNCHEFRLSRRMCKTFQAQLHLVNCGKAMEALELHDMLSHVAHRAGIEHGLAGSATAASRGGASTANAAAKRNEAEAAAAATIDEILTQKLATPLPMGGPKLTSHERSVRRQIIKDFTAACNGLNKCENCRAVSPKIRQDSSNKIFQVPLEKVHVKSNAAERIKLLSALDIEQIGNGGGSGRVASGYDSDASDMEGAAQDSDEDGDDNDEMDVDKDDNGGVASLFDDEAEEVDDDDDAVGGYKKRDASVKKLGDASANKGNKRAADKYLHPLEVEAQARLTWQLQPRLCAMVFGSAHCNDADGGVTGYGIYFMRNVAVPPSRFRPPMVLGTMTVEHAQNIYLNKIVELNDRVRSFIALVQSVPDEMDGLSATERTKRVAEKERAESRAFSNWINLQTQVNCFMDSSKDPSAASAALAANIPSGIRQLLEKKEGIFRK